MSLSLMSEIMELVMASVYLLRKLNGTVSGFLEGLTRIKPERKCVQYILLEIRYVKALSPVATERHALKYL